MDNLTKEQRHKNMVNIKGKNTSIEVCLCKALWNKGIRYRKNYNKLPGKPDIAITKYKIAVFCDSRFFHGKDWEVLKPRLERGIMQNTGSPKYQETVSADEEVNKGVVVFGLDGN